MRMLVLGGTSFVGRHLVEAALAGNHAVTLFNRGRTNADLFAGADRRIGDREASDLAALADGEWDAVVDVNGYLPRHVRESAELLRGRVGAYCFISTGSVYADLGAGPIDEGSPVHETDPGTEEITNESYGPLKVQCERVVQEVFGDAALVVRPGIVAGPHDPTERFTHWVREAAKGGAVVGPSRPEQPVQVVHARDQGDFVVTLLENGARGVFNSVGPDEPATFADLLAACARGAGTEVEVAWTPADELRDRQLQLPLALPESGELDGIFLISNARARAAGLRNRALADTARDTLAWAREAPPRAHR